MKLSAISYQLSAMSLIIAFFLLFSCGKKEPPTLKAYEKPDAPSGLKAIHRENNIILSWSYNKRENLKGFHVLRAAGTGSQQEDAEFKKITLVEKDANSYTDADFKTDTQYKYKIVARSLKNVLSNDSNVITVRPLPVPPAPENVSFLAGNDALSISWGSAGENIFYNIYKSPDKGKYGINPINAEPIKTTLYSDTFELTKPVYYTIRSLLKNGYRNEGPASDEIEVNPVDFVPSRPEGLQAIFAGDKVVIAWKENPEVWVKKYRVYRKTNESEGFKPAGEPVTPAFTDREKTGTKHVYKITAIGPSKESESSGAVAVDF
ncbi:MAG: hypothetical protein Q7T83_13620 [Thermodesulfovibrionales bacterium]|nr:hypothetical protein [Daejeonella sp.]MDO9289817.1 hypothetical protein [Thermodesulfovibrionales bacterium]MDP3112372.1 hypothetical protein [Thermodesulfovibrionales bacterium]